MVYTYFLLPETKALSLEELDTVFKVGNREHSKYYTEKLPHYARNIFRKDKEAYPPLYQIGETGEKALDVHVK